VVVRILALVQIFIKKLKEKVSARKKPQPTGNQEPVVLKLKVSNWERESRIPFKKTTETVAVNIAAAEMAEAADYFFRKATKEVKRFTKTAECEHCSSEQKGSFTFLDVCWTPVE
jgi:hypothetical protein